MTAGSSSFGSRLRAAAPDRLVDVADAYVRSCYPTAQLEVMLADYRVSGLWPVLRTNHSSAGELTDWKTAARAFAGQEPIVEPATTDRPARVFIPLSLWRERLGVMVVDLQQEPHEEQLGVLRSVAAELVVALMAADRATDRYRRVRRRQRLTMAAEMQWELLPGRALGGAAFHLAGQLEPAYRVCGDHFDWSLNDQRLTVTVLNGDGFGLAATMLTAVAVTAMRNARRSGADLAEQAGLATEAVFGSRRGTHHVATVLLDVDLATGAVSLIDAGSPLLLLMRGPEVTVVEVDHQLPLGMFADTSYTLQHFELRPGDRLFVVSDGVHAAAPPGRMAFGEQELITSVRGTRRQTAPDAVGNVMRGLYEYHEGHGLADDAVIVCLDWYGPPRERGDPA